MNIIEVKNNLIKICYEEELTLSGLIQIKDINKSYIAQILHMEASRIGKTAVAKIIFNYDNGIHAYDGSIPSLRAELNPVDTTHFLNILDHTDPLVIGKLAGQKDNIVVNVDILNDNPIILAEKFFVTKILLNNLAIQLQARKKKIVVFDTAGVFKNNKLTATKDFKLPLNNSTINYIYEKGFVDATAESKALIQSIFEELSEYSKTVEFIPFDTFKAVVDSEFMRTKLMQLVILKNKIKQIRDWNIFAQDKAELEYLKNRLEKDSTIIIDISNLKESLQKESIKYVYSILKNINSEFYAFTPLTGENSDKFLLKEILDTENVHSTLICDYDYANLNELKKSSKNMLMFTPLKQQKDFGGYNIFLQKLAEDEFIAYGKMTKFVPIIGKLSQINSSDVYIPKEEIVLPKPELKEEPIAQTDTPAEEPVSAEEPILEEETVQVEQVESLEAANVVTESAETTEIENVEESVIEDTQISVDETIEQPEEPEQEINVVEEEPIEVETVQPETIEEISQPIVETIEAPEVEVSEMASASAQEVVPQEVIENTPVQPIVDEVQEALNEVQDIDDDDELSDDDLDMIENLSKPDEDIPVINQTESAIPQEVQEEDNFEQVVESETEPTQEETIEETEPIVDTADEEPVQEQIVEEQPVQEDAPQNIQEEAEVQNATIPQPSEPLQTRAKSSPVVPEYSAEIPDEDKVNSDVLQQGDKVMHDEFGEGVVEKLINYGDKVLCSINFASVGRRLLNPEISEMRKI